MSSNQKAFLASLSREQMVAATTTDNPVMTIAGAGSGKTRTLAGRLIHLITPRNEGGLGADSSSIMMVTFTNKAAREMRERILPIIEEAREANPGLQMGEPWIGTFHGLSLKILKIESRKAGLGQNFSIFDESDSRSLAQDVAEQLDLESFDVDQFFRDLEVAKARLLSHELLAEKYLQIQMAAVRDEPMPRALDVWSRIFGHFQTPGFTRVYSAYQRALEDQNAVDFSDLMNRVTTMFRENEDVRNSWRSTFRHFMVDEVQDINRAQIAWLDALTDGGREMEIPQGAIESEYADAGDGLHEVNTYRLRKFPRPTVAFVGDDDQAIYGFRGSDVGVMRSLETRYPGLEINFLKESYRCQPSILSVANTLVGKNTGRYGKDLVPADPARNRTKVIIEEHTTPDDEIRRILVEAKAHIRSGAEPSEFAVLVRTRDLVKAVARELRGAGLPVTEGKASDIRKSAEVRDAMAFAGFLVNPEAETLLRRIVNKPSRGLGPTSMGRVGANARLKNISFIEELRSIMNDKIDLPDDAEPYKKAFIKNIKQFGQLIVEMREQVSSARDAGVAMERVLDLSGYLPDLKRQALASAGMRDSDLASLPPREFLSRLIEAKSEGREKVDEMDGEDLADRASQLSETGRRIGNLSILIEQAAQVDTLENFMQEATLEMDQQTAQAGIQVMTVHASKGLEFDRVRLPFWIDGVVPHGRAVMEGEDEIEEERRLAYVALTRAREDVRISRSWRIQGTPYIRQRESRPSRFIRDIQASPKVDFALTSVKGKSHRLYRMADLPECDVRMAAPEPDGGTETPHPSVDPLSREAPDPGRGPDTSDTDGVDRPFAPISEEEFEAMQANGPGYDEYPDGYFEDFPQDHPEASSSPEPEFF